MLTTSLPYGEQIRTKISMMSENCSSEIVAHGMTIREQLCEPDFGIETDKMNGVTMNGALQGQSDDASENNVNILVKEEPNSEVPAVMSDVLLTETCVEAPNNGALPTPDGDVSIDVSRNMVNGLNEASIGTPTLLVDCEEHSMKSPEIKPLNGISPSLFSHPAYKTLLQELAHYKEDINTLQLDIHKLEEEKQLLIEDRSHEMYDLQIETLEKTIGNQQIELERINELGKHQIQTATNNFTRMKDELEGKIEKVSKAYEAANRDKESAVMRYAMSEKEVIDQKKERESLDKRLRETGKEKEILLNKLKGLTNDKSRVCQILDVKCNELTALQKENERMKEDLNSREIKIKWAQNKLRSELDIHKETQTKLDKMTKLLHETREESEQVRRDCQAMMKAYQTSEENKAFTLEQQLKEHQAQLILERHDHQVKEETYRQHHAETEALKKKHQLILNENNLLSIKVQNLEKERLEYEQNISKLKGTLDSHRENIADLQARLAEMESLRIQLQHEQERLGASQSEVERLRLSNIDLQQDMASCREKEAELLDFTEKLTDKNVRLQSEFTATEAKAQELEFQVGPQQRQIADLEVRVAGLAQQLAEEKRTRADENKLLTRHLAEKTKRADELGTQLEDQQGENEVLRRKQAAALKELMRELQHARRRAEQLEAGSGGSSLDQASRASSVTSLNAMEPPATKPTAAAASTGADSSPGSNGRESPEEPDRKALIEHIVKLQRANARKAEKLEFMEEHAQQLVAELQKKTRIVQGYILRDQCGALSNDTMDQNKAEVAKRGGIMASVYGSKAVDETMTFELSMEINNKLQAVLEDTLLKNITLKDNIETLGSEISRLLAEKNSSNS